MGTLRLRRPALLRWGSWSAGLLGSLFTTAASAEVAPVVIEYRSTSACPGEAAFLAAVRAQTPNLRPPISGGSTRRLAIDIVVADDAVVGTLRVDELDGTSSVREVEGPRCDAVASALALFTALTIDGGPTSSPARVAAPARPRPALPSARPRSSEAAGPSAPRVGIGALAGVFGGLAPALSGGVEPFFDWSAWGRSGLAPSLRVAVAFAASPNIATRGGTVGFLWLAGRLSACPWAVALGPFTGRPCAGLDAGILHGQGGNIAHPAGSTRPWIAPTLSARTHWAVAPTTSVEVDAGISVPLLRDQFVFDAPTLEAHAVPSISGFVGVGIAFLLGTPAPRRFP